MGQIPGIIKGLQRAIEAKSSPLRGKAFMDLSCDELRELTEIGILVEEKEYWESVK